MALSAKQKRFVAEYLVDLNATQAAIRAGYSAKTAKQQGSRLLTNGDISRAVTERNQKREERTGITSEYVLETIRETVERCRQAEPVVDRKGEAVLTETPDGSLARAYAFDSKGVLKGCELLGRNLALWKDRLEHTGANGGPIETKELSENEAARRIAFILAQGMQTAKLDS